MCNAFLTFRLTEAYFQKTVPLLKLPQYKKGNKNDPNNYRLITILTCFSKILERIICNRFFEFLKKHNTIYKAQYGFQKQLSTTHAIPDIVTTSLDNVNLNLFNGLVFLELQKAFDIIGNNTTADSETVSILFIIEVYAS